jgi:H2-forming N5,N10-methylenetetrahydromethanopterin dehydrogenase-like enzyme
MDAGDYDGALVVGRRIVQFSAEKFGKLIAIKEMIEKRIEATKATVFAAVQQNATDGLKEVVEIWKTQGGIKSLTGIDPDDFDLDTFVAQTGPYWLKVRS